MSNPNNLLTNNIGKPVQNVTQYAELAIAVGKTLKPAFPNEIYIGPAISWFGRYIGSKVGEEN
jgi:hypothetical protein